jgi:hypothetical protein
MTIDKNWFKSKNFNPANYAVSAVLVYLRAMYEENKQLGFDVWNEQSDDQPANLPKLLIADKQTWDTTHRGHLPSIVLQRNLISFGGGIQDGGPSRVMQAGFQLETSVMEIVTVPMVLSCIARQDLEAESLAFMTGQFLWDDKRWMKPFRLFGMSSPQISDVQIYNPSENAFICNLITSFSLAKTYTTRALPEQKVAELALILNGQLTTKIQS